MDKLSTNCIPYEDQHGIKELRKTQNQIGLDYRAKMVEEMKKDLMDQMIYPPILLGCKQSCVGTPFREDNFSLGTLPETLTKETTMFRDQDCFNIPAPSSVYSKCTAKSTQANIDLQVNMPPAKDPEEKMRNHLLERAGTASYEKRNDLRKAYNLDDDDRPTTIKDFFARIKDGKFTIPTDEKELTRERWNTENVIDEITWRDPARKADHAGFEAAQELLNKALNDTSDEIIVKTPEAGLESLRAFQAKTFH